MTYTCEMLNFIHKEMHIKMPKRYDFSTNYIRKKKTNKRFNTALSLVWIIVITS